MQFFSLSQPRPLAQPPEASLPAQPPADALGLETKPCGWFDSSFELAAGLEISEQEDDLLYQLCELFLH